MSKHIIIEKKPRIVFDEGPKNQKKDRAKSQRKVRAEKKSRFNAVKSGAYAAGLLPLESMKAYQKHCAAFRNSYEAVGYIERGLVRDMARNRWQRRRTKLMVAIAMYRHPFGRTLMECGAQSWQEVASLVRKSNTRTRETLESIGASMLQLVELGGQIKQETLDSEVVSECLHKIADSCSNSFELLEDIRNKLDQEREFFEQYMPQKLEQIVRVDNALDAQFEKMHFRLQVVQEARLRRDQLLLSNQQAAAVLLLGKPGDRRAATESALDHEETAPASQPGDQVDDADERPDPFDAFVNEQKKQ
jgi:hypothetical protein